MARVFVARDHQLDRDIVVKVMHGELSEGLSAERFTREMKLAVSLQHPNIVPVLGAGATRAGLPWYTMPFIPGESLRARLATPLPAGEAVAVLRDVAAALAYAHQAGVVHRDIKPENILLSAGTALVADFGIAKAMVDAAASPPDEAMTMEGRLTRAGTLLGTPAYMAPEQAAGESVGTPADVCAWGMVAYEALTGAHPFAGKISAQQLILAHMTERPDDIQHPSLALPKHIGPLVMRCLEKDPALRPRAGRELLEALRGE